jgi:hypothetical protein
MSFSAGVFTVAINLLDVFLFLHLAIGLITFVLEIDMIDVAGSFQVGTRAFKAL